MIKMGKGIVLVVFAVLLSLAACDQDLVVGGDDPPLAPTGLAASRGDGRVSLSWNVAANATSYTVHWKEGATVAATDPLKAEGITGTVYDCTGLTNGTAYAFIVVAVGGGMASAPSEIVTMTPQVPAPGIPQNVSWVGVPGTTSVELCWDEVEGAQTYNIY